MLVGMQMIAKGHRHRRRDAGRRVGADMALGVAGLPRGGEKLLQLLTQVAGRAGRGESPGKVAWDFIFRTMTRCSLRRGTTLPELRKGIWILGLDALSAVQRDCERAHPQ